MLLLARDATVTICHSATPDLAAECRMSDIIISAAGSFLHGDVAFDEVSPIVSNITPVPRGIGVIAGSFLARNLITAAENLTNG